MKRIYQKLISRSRRGIFMVWWFGGGTESRIATTQERLVLAQIAELALSWLLRTDEDWHIESREQIEENGFPRRELRTWNMVVNENLESDEIYRGATVPLFRVANDFGRIAAWEQALASMFYADAPEQDHAPVIEACLFAMFAILFSSIDLEIDLDVEENDDDSISLRSHRRFVLEAMKSLNLEDQLGDPNISIREFLPYDVESCRCLIPPERMSEFDQLCISAQPHSEIALFVEELEEEGTLNKAAVMTLRQQYEALPVSASDENINSWWLALDAILDVYFEDRDFLSPSLVKDEHRIAAFSHNSPFGRSLHFPGKEVLDRSPVETLPALMQTICFALAGLPEGFLSYQKLKEALQIKAAKAFKTVAVSAKKKQKTSLADQVEDFFDMPHFCRLASYRLGRLCRKYETPLKEAAPWFEISYQGLWNYYLEGYENDES